MKKKLSWEKIEKILVIITYIIILIILGYAYFFHNIYPNFLEVILVTWLSFIVYSYKNN